MSRTFYNMRSFCSLSLSLFISLYLSTCKQQIILFSRKTHSMKNNNKRKKTLIIEFTRRKLINNTKNTHARATSIEFLKKTCFILNFLKIIFFHEFWFISMKHSNFTRNEILELFFKLVFDIWKGNNGTFCLNLLGCW